MKLTRKFYGVLRRGMLCDPDGCPTPRRWTLDDFESQRLGMTRAQARRVRKEHGGRIVAINVTISTRDCPEERSPRKKTP